MFFNLQLLLVLKRLEFNEGRVCPFDTSFQIILSFLSKFVKIVFDSTVTEQYRNLIVLKMLFSIKKKHFLRLFFQSQDIILKKDKLASVRRFFRILLYDNYFCSRLKIPVPKRQLTRCEMLILISNVRVQCFIYNNLLLPKSFIRLE